MHENPANLGFSANALLDAVWNEAWGRCIVFGSSVLSPGPRTSRSPAVGAVPGENVRTVRISDLGR